MRHRKSWALTGRGRSRSRHPARCFLTGALLLACLRPLPAQAQKIYTYVGRIGADSVLLAWGTAEGGGNTIGRNSAPLGKASVRVGDLDTVSEKNWVEISGLLPDTEYPYRVQVDGTTVGEGSVRTFPAEARRLCFFVLGDFGTGKRPQYEIAAAMEREFEARQASDNPVRFVLTTGDNIYSDRILGIFPRRTGSKDRDWEAKFFEPYAPLLRHVPFYATLGNHDNSGSETRGDLAAYLDNFFFPGDAPARYYSFSYGQLADFFALDTTLPRASSGGTGESRQMGWLREALGRSRSRWKIAYFHHPPFTAGPGHGASLRELEPLVKLLPEAGVQAVFTGHEHNFQFSERNGNTGGVIYFVSGAGGSLRNGDVQGKIERAQIAGWSGQHHFLVVELEGETMKVTPLGSEPILVHDKDGKIVSMPVVVHASKGGGALAGSSR